MNLAIPDKVPIPGPGGGKSTDHLFDPTSKWAIWAALTANRPLLVRGEPGVGKSQLAHAAAVALNRPFLSLVVNARTESHELLYSFDAVHRLAQAQICKAVKGQTPEELLTESKFIHPGKLWWAFDWADAARHAGAVNEAVPNCPKGWNPGDGCVLLIDEIDKAESDVPNGLLEALGSHSFPVRGRKDPVSAIGNAPLVVITTNEDRMLPNAFVRRCLVLNIELPADDVLREFLVERGLAHQPKMKRDILSEAADLVIQSRKEQKHVRPRPGQAEFLDLIRAVSELPKHSGPDKLTPKELLQKVNGFVLKKNSGTPA